MTEILLPPAGTGPGIVLAHAWWGLNQTMRDYGAALAEQGFVIALPDLFDGRLATTVEGAQELADTDWTPDAAERLTQCVEELAANPAAAGSRVGLIGFSYSGFAAYGLAGRAELPLGRVVVYYATRQLAGDHVPVLAHFADKDPFESDEDMREVATGLANDGAPNMAYSYPGTTHWFAEADRPEFEPQAAALALERTVAFLREMPTGA